jgi:hypothetical protein
MAVGLPLKTTYANGDVYSASDVNDTNGTINLVAQTQNFYAGKNAIINGNFGVWQRGTSFTPAASAYVFTADRMGVSRDGTGATVTVSRQAFTPGTAPVTGYESQFFFRYAQTVAGTGGTYLTVCSQKIEDVRSFANQTVAFSFWAKADATRTVSVGYGQIFGSGGSGDVYGSLGSSITLTTSWVRYSVTGTIPSISGKTVGTGSFLELYISGAQNTAQTIDIWGVQLEAGSTATAFEIATGTIQGELAACQRYYWQIATGSGTSFALASAEGSNTPLTVIQAPVTMRIAPSLVQTTGSAYYVIRSNAGINTFSTFIQDNNSVNGITIYATSATITAGNAGRFITNNASSSIALSAEL